MWWLTDPKSDKKSVSLTMLAITFLLFVALSTCEALGYEIKAGGVSELFYASTSLYFFRKLTFKGKNVEIHSKGNE